MLIEYFLFAAIFKVTQRSRKLHCRISFSKKDLDDLKVVVKTSYSIYLEGMEEKIKSFYSNEKLTNKFFDNLDKAIKQQSPKCSINYSLFEKTIPKCKDYIFKDRNGYIYLYLYIFLKLFKKNTQNYSSDTNKANRLMSGADLFTGHYYELNHYYRHTYQMVKKIANYNNDIISYVEKRNYLKMLRAQLTSDEQTLLFYNWLSGYGSDWENDKNHFFTTYRMIHNINPNVMRIIIFGGKDKVIQMIKDTNPEYNKYENDNLFEFEDKMN